LVGFEEDFDRIELLLIIRLLLEFWEGLTMHFQGEEEEPRVCSASLFRPTMFSFWFSTSSRAVESSDFCRSERLISVMI